MGSGTCGSTGYRSCSTTQWMSRASSARAASSSGMSRWPNGGPHTTPRGPPPPGGGVEWGGAGEQLGHVGLAERRLAHPPERHRLREGEVPAPPPLADLRVDLFEVDVRDAVRVLADDVDVVPAAVRHVAGVEAEVD